DVGNGSHSLVSGLATFSNVVLNVPGSISLIAQDTAGTVLGTLPITVLPATKFVATAGDPTAVDAEQPFNFTIAAVDPRNQPVTAYTGPVKLLATDALGLVIDLSGGLQNIAPGDGGQHTFAGVVLNTPGTYVLTAISGDGTVAG